MRKTIAIICALLGAASSVVALSGSATAGTAPSVLSLSTHRGAYWGGTTLTVRGANFDHVKKVTFGSATAWNVKVRSSGELTVTSPWHKYGTVTVRVVTKTGTSAKNRATSFTFAKPRMSDKIQGGLTGTQEQRISKKVRAAHRNVPTAKRSRAWTPAMGLTAARRATSWLGIPYSWAGGNSRGPTKGVCSHNGGDLDCRIVGFDCSGLALYAWGPYKAMAHYAATQRSQAGRFHPGAGELVPGDLVFFSGYISNGVGHVAIYVGNGIVVQAAESGTVVMRSRLDDVIAANGKYRGATRPTSTGRQGAVPVVSTVTPTMPTTGGLLTITGKNLTSTTAVTISGKRYYSFSKTANRLVVKVPAHKTGTGSISVSNAWGTARRSTTYVAAPSLTTLSPARGPVTGGNDVTLTGRRFMSINAVTVGTTRVPFRRLSDTQLIVTMPAQPAGAVVVRASSVYGTSNAVRYTYLAPAPTTSAPPAPTTSAPPSTTSAVPSTGTTSPSATGTKTSGTTSAAPKPSTATSSTSAAKPAPSTASTKSGPPTASTSVPAPKQSMTAPRTSSAATPAG